MLLLIALIVINIFILMNMNTGTGKKWTVYGTMGCGWTRKQLEYMKKTGKSYTFVDCDKEDCGKMSAFPTLHSPDGKETVGFKEI